MNKVAALSLWGVVCLVCQAVARPQDNAASAQASGQSAAPAAGDKGNVTILKSEITPLNDKGSFGYDIELSDGTKLIQSGHTEAPGMGQTEPSLVIEGSYAYVAPDGKQISISYIADKNGFQPKGDAIPSQAGSGTVQSSGSGGAAAAPAPQASQTEAPATASSAAA